VEKDDGYRLPPGRQPYDPLNGLRIGAFAGGILGAIAAGVTRFVWFLPAGAVLGGAVGYLSERATLRGKDGG
jgi:hypothetical protein